MTTSRRPSAAANIAHVVATILIAGILFTFLIVMVPSAIDAIGGNGQSVDIEQTVRPDRLASLPMTDDGCSQPECVALADQVPVKILVLNATGKQILLDRLRLLLSLSMGAATLWILRNVIDSVRKGEPFVRANVNRLRKLGLLLLVGWPLVEVATNFITGGLADTTKFGSLGSSWNIPPAPGAMLGGLVVLIIAETFNHGLRLREDIEGTV